ncbi:hypothetical protein HNR77_003354 [Paenibacillus sp. JGP012]|uniref:DUF3969 family protein n=1 Tax=Paenibacillus sp. JGP012 TaxID=2735914 RepID=UPI00161294C0|nr:DUF3969 family protein [Paenibacillus sp. JGP012]MBB6022257.1 hypothetical protein [Paenibacillus sp. JGP012]
MGIIINFKIEISDKEEIEAFYSILILGCITAIKEELLTWDQAEERLFSPITLAKIEKLNLHSTLKEITNQGMMELNLLQQLNLRRYDKVMHEIEKRLKTFIMEQKISEGQWIHWIK